MKIGENCICGSGRKFEVCCELYIDKTIEDYKVELKKIIKLMHMKFCNRYSSKYLFSNLLVCGNCGAGFRCRTERGKIVWRCGTRMEKGKMACGCSLTLQDETMKRILAVAVCGGVYDENIVKNKVKRVDVYEKRIIICFAEENEYKVCSL